MKMRRVCRSSQLHPIRLTYGLPIREHSAEKTEADHEIRAKGRQHARQKRLTVQHECRSIAARSAEVLPKIHSDLTSHLPVLLSGHQRRLFALL